MKPSDSKIRNYASSKSIEYLHELRLSFIERIAEDEAHLKLVEAMIAYREHYKKTNKTPRTWKYKGLELTVYQLLKIATVPISYSTLRSRLMSGWDVERAVSTPVKAQPWLHRNGRGE